MPAGRPTRSLKSRCNWATTTITITSWSGGGIITIIITTITTTTIIIITRDEQAGVLSGARLLPIRLIFGV